MRRGPPIRWVTRAPLRSAPVTHVPVRPILHHPRTVPVPIAVARVRARPTVGATEAVPVGVTVMPLKRVELAVVDPDTPTVCRSIAAEGDAAQVAVTTGCAVVAAQIVVVVVAIVALLNTSPDMPITAPRRRAVRQARVRVAVVGVVTSLDPCSDMPITTASRRAVGEATIRLRVVAVVARFDASPDMSITAASRRAVR